MAEDRYSRQTLLPEIGPQGQKKLGESRVVVIGCGALGTHSLSFLARGGVGSVTVVDRDVVDITNLQRQTLFDENDVGRPKALVAEERLRRINSDIKVRGIVGDLNASTAEDIVRGASVVVDATDNMEARFLLNDVCVKNRTPWIYGGAVGVSGMVLAVTPEGPCLRCVLPTPPAPGTLPTCDTVGITNTLPSVVASIEATEAYKIMMGSDHTPELVVIDAWTHDIQKVNVKKNPDCPCCGRREFEFLREGPEALTVSLCGRGAIQVSDPRRPAVDLETLGTKLRRSGEVILADNVLRFRGEDAEFVVFADGRTIISGVSDLDEAKSVYAKYVGD